MQGVNLHSDVFEEPEMKTAASGASKLHYYTKRRKGRFTDVKYAIDSLIDWVKLERKHYKYRVARTPEHRQPLKTSGHAGSRVAGDICEAEYTNPGRRRRTPQEQSGIWRIMAETRG